MAFLVIISTNIPFYMSGKSPNEPRGHEVNNGVSSINRRVCTNRRVIGVMLAVLGGSMIMGEAGDAQALPVAKSKVDSSGEIYAKEKRRLMSPAESFKQQVRYFEQLKKYIEKQRQKVYDVFDLYTKVEVLGNKLLNKEQLTQSDKDDFIKLAEAYKLPTSDLQEMFKKEKLKDGDFTSLSHKLAEIIGHKITIVNRYYFLRLQFASQIANLQPHFSELNRAYLDEEAALNNDEIAAIKDLLQVFDEDQKTLNACCE